MRRFICVLLGLGLCFRLILLDHKIYWYDETFTSLRAAGYTEAELVQHFTATPLTQASELLFYQQPNPDRTLGDTLLSLAIEDTQHPPLYYALAYGWMRLVGGSITAMRRLPALLSLLVFPCAYWLGAELQRRQSSSATPNRWGWLLMGVLAVSPFQVLYAQESRQYSLWSVTILLMTATLLRALRRQTLLNWLLYGLSTALGLYTFLFTGLVTLAHGSYVLGHSKSRLTRSLLAFGVATGVGVMLFVPWFWTVATQLSQVHRTTGWAGDSYPLTGLVSSWAVTIARLFYDGGNSLFDRLLRLGLLALVGVAFYVLGRRTVRSVWLLPVTLTIIPALALIGPDVLLGGLRSTIPRYLIPSLLGIQLAVVGLFAVQLERTERSHRRFLGWAWGFVAIALVGIYSCSMVVQAPVWWNKVLNKENKAVAAVINQADRPLVLSDSAMADLLSLSHDLRPTTELLIRPRCYTCHLPDLPTLHPDLVALLDGDRSDSTDSDSVDSDSIDLEDYIDLENYSDIFLFRARTSRNWEPWKRSLDEIQTIQLVPASPEADVLWRVVLKQG